MLSYIIMNDGMEKGYPDGLSKEGIPLLSRIISIVDAYDAMVNDRVYRPAISVKEALEELKRCAGKQFDPSIVSEFIQMIQEKDAENLITTRLSAKAV